MESTEPALRDKFGRDIQKRNTYAREWRQRNAARLNEERRDRLRTDPEFAERMRARDRARYLEYRKDHRLRKLGISLREYEGLCAAQNGACSICGRDDQPLMADHCHKSGKFRSLLCRSCNSLLGWYERYQDRINGILKRKSK